MFVIQLLTIALLLGTRSASAATCYNRWGQPYYCNNGLSWGARLGIGLGIAFGVILLFALCGYWRRRNLRSQFAKYKPPSLPFAGHNQDQNPYASNPPPPSGFNNNPYGNNPAPPPQTYQPSMAGQYGSYQGQTEGVENHEHGYEWEQARQEEEERRKQGGQTSDIPPPGYDVATSKFFDYHAYHFFANLPLGAQNTGSNAATYAPPPGPPPGKREGAV
ncbi:hypothetical protein I315_03366 [Cryptococcus gattii Ru294]|nr:hypothetical protein I315_03366 [Cryptococcus gattii Ru294]